MLMSRNRGLPLEVITMRQKCLRLSTQVKSYGRIFETAGISQYKLAKDINVPARRINEIVHGKRSISADTALRLSRYFNLSERFG